MKKIESIIRYKMRHQFTWVAWSVVIIVFVMFLTFFPLIKYSLINQTEGSLVYRLWVLVLVQFGIMMRFKEDFDFLLTLSIARKTICLSQLIVAFGFSACISGLIVLERLLVDLLNNFFGYHNIKDPFHFFSPYGTDNLFMLFAFFLVLSTCCSILGFLMGSLFYRLGKKITMAFWITISAIPMVLFSLLLWLGHLTSSIMAMGKFLSNFDLPASSGYLFVLIIVFSIAAYLNIRRLPQK